MALQSNVEIIREWLDLLLEGNPPTQSNQMTSTNPNGATPATDQKVPNAQSQEHGGFSGIQGPINMNNLAASLGVRNVPLFVQALQRLKNPPANAAINQLLTVPQMAELANAFYKLLTDTTGGKINILNQIRLISRGDEH